MVHAAVGQFTPSENTSENLDAVRRFAEEAQQQGASLLVLPEYSSFTAPRFDGRIVENAEPLHGPFVTAVSQIARQRELAIVAGMIERIPERPTAYNTVVMVGPDGDLAATYRKVHLYDALGVRESEWIEPGQHSDAPMIEIDGMRFGAQTCYDLRFPESTRVLIDAGADVVIVVAQWVPGPLKEDHWTTLLRARAIENTAYVLAAGQSGPTGTGHSMIVDPMGVVIAGIGDPAGLISADIQRDRIDRVREANPVLTARRFRVTPS
jgi:predicted amidohydrolase